MAKANCPAIGNEWEFECEKALTHFCPFSCLAIGLEARRKNLPDCPDAPEKEEADTGNKKARPKSQTGQMESIRMDRQSAFNLLLRSESDVKSSDIEYNAQAKPGSRFMEADT